MLLAIFVGILPVLLFLSALQIMDSYKLVTRRDLLHSAAAGALAAALAFALNTALLRVLNVPPHVVTRYAAPVFEEALKALLVVYFVRADKVGFMVDAAIHGFAVGTGFAVLENLYYAWALQSPGIGLWIVRGLGTAILHGSTTGIVAILAKDLTERHRSKGLALFLPGMAIACAVHSFYNHLLFNPLLATAALLVLMPLLVVAIYERSERATRDWLGAGLDSDMERLELILGGEERHSPIGEYLESLRHRFAGPVLADMLCLLRIHLELSMRAKGMLIARAAGVELPPDESVRANLEELRYLEHSIGGTGRLAMLPLLQTSSRDLWQICMLRK
jgi:RsiW-degrading membrane proteinase PrsW (M82 family)